MRALAGAIVAVLAVGPGLAREIGTLPFSGQMAFEWIALETEGDGTVHARYRARGGTDGDGGGEALLAGFDLVCHGTMRFRAAELLADRASCTLKDRFGQGMWLDLTAEAGPWGWHALAARLVDGSGPYRRLRGSALLTRVMHGPPETPMLWAYFIGAVSWVRE